MKKTYIYQRNIGPAIALFLLMVVSICCAQAPDTLWTRAYPNGQRYAEIQALTTTIDGGFAFAGKVRDSLREDPHPLIIKTDSLGNQEWYTRYLTPYGLSPSFQDIISLPNGNLVGIAATFCTCVDLSGDTVWTNFYWEDADLGTRGIVTSDGGFVVVGNGRDPEAVLISAALYRFSSDGELLWRKYYPQPGFHSSPFPHAVAHAPGDGFLIVTEAAWEFPEPERAVYIIRVDSIGDTLWTNELRVPNRRLDIRTICVNDDWEYTVAGITRDTLASSANLFIAKIDMNGDSLWTRSYEFFPMNKEVEIIPTSDGGVVVCSTHPVLPYLYNGALILRVDSTGDLVWSRVYAPADDTYEYYIGGVVATPDGGYAAGWDLTAWNWRITTPVLFRFEPDTFLTSPPHHLSPVDFSLMEVYPNPFNPTTTISFDLNHPSMVKLKVFDITGRLVSTLVDDNMAVGVHSVMFDGRDQSSGIYFARLLIGNKTETKKLVLIK